MTQRREGSQRYILPPDNLGRTGVNISGETSGFGVG